MSDTMKIHILGCGTSGGVPMIGKGWGDCDPNNPKNFRQRCAIVMKTPNSHILVDIGTDIKNQLVSYGRTDFDGVFVTHEHADHIHGLDDLRWVCMANNKPLKLYAKKHTLQALKDRFAYAFEPLPEGCTHYFKPVLEGIIIDDSITVNGDKYQIIEQNHGKISSIGFRYNDFAYCTDVVDFPNGLEELKGVKTWIVDCLRREPHGTHAHLDMVKEWVQILSPDMTYLTHMDLTMDYQTLCDTLPENIRPAYDGLILSI